MRLGQHRSLQVVIFLAALLGVGATGMGRAAELTPEEHAFFEAKIRPVLVRECYGCHSNETGNAKGGLRLDTMQLAQIGGSSGAAVVPGDLEQSLLFNAITHQDFVMPPNRKLPDNVIADFRKWIEMGAPDPRETVIGEIKSTISATDIAEAKRSFWAYQLPIASPPPAVRRADWPKSDIDRFVLARLEYEAMQPPADAPPDKLLRRLCFDLVGLPPTPEQLENFVGKWHRSPDDAIDWMVETLLSTPQFGERWGRHWLDVARYAESTGREVNMTYPHAWRYRDYVIDAFNADKPFDQFVREQLAGDLLPAKDDQQWSQQLIATSFLALGPKNVNEQNRVQFAADVVDEQIDTTTRVLLGTSVACARCHDHKFDAIPQTDYYALAGIFRNMKTYFGNPPSELGEFNSVQARQTSSLLQLPVDDPSSFDKHYSPTELASLQEQIRSLQAELLELRRSRQRDANGNAGQSLFNTLRVTNQLAELTAKLAVVDQDGNPHSYCMGVQETTSTSDVRLLIRGEIDQPAQLVPRGFPQVLSTAGVAIPEGSSGRLELANWIASRENPLTSRVMVNRIWQQMIGQGIVTSTENFGVTGAAPSHPQLLDYLALRFVQSDWSVKTLVGEIARSRVYRMASDFQAEYHQQDPENALLWRANPRRLDAEALRDAMLLVSGELETARPRGSEVAKAGYVRVRDGVLGNPREQIRAQMVSMQNRGRSRGRLGGFGAQRPTGMMAYRELAKRITGALNMEEAKIRSVYLPIVRDETPRSLEVFDFADANSVIGTREASNTANQALYMLNNPFVIQQSEALAERIRREHHGTAQRIEAAFVSVYGRLPRADESTASVALLSDLASSGRRDRGVSAWAVFCQSLFASAEFRFLD